MLIHKLSYSRICINNRLALAYMLFLNRYIGKTNMHECSIRFALDIPWESGQNFPDGLDEAERFGCCLCTTCHKVPLIYCCHHLQLLPFPFKFFFDRLRSLKAEAAACTCTNFNTSIPYMQFDFSIIF